MKRMDLQNLNRFRARTQTSPLCPVCGLKEVRCICSQLPRLSLRTRLSLVIHTHELKRPSNTGTLALQVLANSDVRVRGLHSGTPLDLSDLILPEHENLLLYPTEGAEVLSPASVFSRPVHLIVPDGNWGQARKVHTRHPELKNLRRVQVQRKQAATHFLRKETREHGMSTLEAIALAFGVLEGPGIGEQLMRVYQLKLQNVLLGRGNLGTLTPERPSGRR